ncbi:hypothetical protein L226DRAFT_464547 [Lentinus tigrinus ALCF2SS1-7]|uniref:DDE Tnp4 domain-containing protein n=1 Tax=Lentinus tigrinus ALCF2SS1-6 TaxID=1328759 RepID=A0A5C2RST9_9APHY|nr:hypothetical protein L227DRAFT_511315 [Lentinus tigrinus ALCF2SS1-6]RPD73907.1 hypothetical protein L226DRAFT_464547 [Lentinus tigrinus ALCF2SS1-7]
MYVGYPLTKYTIQPFNDYDLTNNVQEARFRHHFNCHLSSLCIFVKHAFGRIKGCFSILRCMPGNDINIIYKTVEALMIIHNIVECFNDNPTDIEGYNREEEDDVDEI